MTLAETSFYLFSIFGALRIVSYVPQIFSVARDTNGASAISYSTWLLWTGSNASTALYAAVSLGDPALAMISTLNTTCCVMVIVLTIFKRKRFHLRNETAKVASSLPVLSNPCSKDVEAVVTSTRPLEDYVGVSSRTRPIDVMSRASSI